MFVVTDHRWEETLVVNAVLGFQKPPRAMTIIAPDPLAVAITGQLCCLSAEHGNGRKILLGPLWLRRAREKASDMEKQIEDL